MSHSERILVIGAGAAGLSCARELQKHGFDVTVLEATERIGGRTINLKGFVSWKALDLGGEFIHGSTTSLMDLVNERGFPCREMFTWAQGDSDFPKHPVNGGMSMYYLGKEKKLVRFDTEESDVLKTNEVLWELEEQENRPESCKKTLDQYLIEKGISETGLSLADAGYANTLCTTLSKLSLKSVITLEKIWLADGEGDFRLENSMCQVMEYLAQNLRVKTKWPVKSIDYAVDNYVEVVSENGEKLYASRVVITVPLGVLKAGTIGFNPPLPSPKMLAIKTIEFEPSMKIIMKFSDIFWPKELHGIICSHSFIPEFWFDNPDRVGALTPFSSPLLRNKINPSEPPTYIVAGFACSNNALRIGALSRQEIITGMLQQLDEMFGDLVPSTLLIDTRIPISPEDQLQNPSKPATAYFMDIVIKDWTKEPYTRGGYSSPSVGESVEMRDDLAAPLNGRLFFAGEATNRSYMSIHGAMESGLRAAKEIISIGGNVMEKSKL